jgi:tetratricopeptide (TPR) repeat protein
MEKMKRILPSIFFLALMGSVYAEQGPSSPQALWDAGNKAYEQGDFSSARQAYEAVVRQGLSSAELWYNLGNTYYRLGRVGWARLCYERARLKNPGEEDIRYNLNLLQSQLQEKEETGFAWLEEKRGPILWAALGFNGFFFGFLALGLFREEEWIWWGRWATGFLFTIFLALGLAAVSQSRRSYGVAVEPRVEVRAGPGPEYQVDFVVPEGQKVVLLETRQDWSQIGVPARGLKGWALRGAVEPVDPSS